MKKMKKSKNFTKIEYEGTKYYEGTPSDIRKIVARLKKEGAVQKNDRYPLREGQLYQLEIVEPKGYNIWAPGIQLKGKTARRANVWDLKVLNVLRVSRPAVFRSLYYEAANSIQNYHLCNAVNTVSYDEPYDVAHEARECILHADFDNEMDVDVINDLRYAIAIMAVCITGVTGDKKRTYRYARKAIKYNRKEFLKLLLKGQIYDYIYGMLDSDYINVIQDDYDQSAKNREEENGSNC